MRTPLSTMHLQDRQPASPSAKDTIVRIGRETKGRKGKEVTVIIGIRLNAGDLQQLTKRIKRHCGAGGTIKNSIIEIQGEHRDSLVDFLTKQGYTVKKSGG